MLPWGVVRQQNSSTKDARAKKGVGKVRNVPFAVCVHDCHLLDGSGL